MAPMLNVLVNPAAGRGRAARLLPRIARRLAGLRLRFEPHISEGPGHLAEIARDLGADGGPLVVCGGDGSVNEVLNGIDGSGATIGLIPCGSGNDLARNLGIPRDPEAACTVLAAGRVRTLDAVDAGGRRYLGVGGAGFDAEVNRRANAARSSRLTRMVYAVEVLSTLASYRARSYRVVADGRTWEGRAMFVAVANAPCYGGGMRISPGSVMDDGRLEVCIVEAMGRLGLLGNFPRVFAGRHVGHPRFRVLPAARVRIESDRPGDFYADGEPQGSLPLEVALLPRAVRVLAPGGAPTS